MTDNLITWNLPNFITIGLMALLFGAIVGVGAFGVSKVTGWQVPGTGQ